jgi:hypothetical protein
LEKILRRRGLEFVLFELLANAWDSNATDVNVTLTAVKGHRLARLVVEDNDPQGFQEITHAYTMFADSLRRGDPEKRGRFNLGEKLVLAVAETATIITTTAGFRFEGKERHRTAQRTPVGSRVDLTFKATQFEIGRILEAAYMLIPPIPTTINGEPLEMREPVTEFTVSLDTVIPDEEGNLKNCQRKTLVKVYDGRPGWLYEMGVPVVETDDTYSYDVQMKVPVNMDRDNVSPSYLRKLRILALNHLHTGLDAEDANATWVRDALSDKTGTISQDAVRSAVKERFGDKVVSYDPNDPEANHRAAAEGYTVVTGKQLSKPEWENIRQARAILPAGQVTPSPKAFQEGGGPLKVIDPEDWSDGMKQVAWYVRRLILAWYGHDAQVVIVNDRHWPYGGAYGPAGPFYINKAKQTPGFFDQGITDEVVKFAIHEGAHERVRDHLSEEYYDELCKLGAKMRNLKHLEDNLDAGPKAAAMTGSRGG